jgi:DNA-binding CsgD family transcriptional regulator
MIWHSYRPGAHLRSVRGRPVHLATAAESEAALIAEQAIAATIGAIEGLSHQTTNALGSELWP